jgi:hypothetical protein
MSLLLLFPSSGTGGTVTVTVETMLVRNAAW